MAGREIESMSGANLVYARGMRLILVYNGHKMRLHKSVGNHDHVVGSTAYETSGKVQYPQACAWQFSLLYSTRYRQESDVLSPGHWCCPAPYFPDVNVGDANLQSPLGRRNMSEMESTTKNHA